MNSNPEITILMPVYNAELYLRQAVDSILNQTLTDFEFLIINDGSTDSSLEILNSYTDSRIRIINQENVGVAKALNTGLDHAKGKYIVRMDADDISYPERVEVLYRFMLENPEYIGVGSNINWIDKDGDFIFQFINDSITDEQIRANFLKVNPFIHAAMIYLKDEALAVGKYPILLNFEDYGLWGNLLKRGKMYNLPQVLMDCRFSPASVSIDEADLGEEYAHFKKKALTKGELTSEDQVRLHKLIKSFNDEKKETSYRRMLAKKYLWNNYQPKKARENICYAIKKEPFKVYNYGIYFFSFFPKRIIRLIYQKVKA